MKEEQIRKHLDEIDRLRADAETCSRMSTGWLNMDFELIAVTPVVVRRRFRRDKFVNAEITMGRDEIIIFRDWLAERASRMKLEADRLANSIAGGDSEVPS